MLASAIRQPAPAILVAQAARSAAFHSVTRYTRGQTEPFEADQRVALPIGFGIGNFGSMLATPRARRVRSAAP